MQFQASYVTRVLPAAFFALIAASAPGESRSELPRTQAAVDTHHDSPGIKNSAIDISGMRRPHPAAITTFVNVAVIPMDRERILQGQTVVVQGDRIISMGPVAQVPVPVGAVRIDGQGQFLMPGLSDMHAHIMHFGADTAGLGEKAAQFLTLNLANGVTTIRFMNQISGVLPLRDRVAKGEVLGPRMYAAVGLSPRTAKSATLTKAAEVEQAKAAGYDHIKFYTNSSKLPGFDSVIAAANRVGLPVTGHSPGDFTEAIRAGYRSIEHLTGYHDMETYPHSSKPGTQVVVDSAELHAFATAMQRAGVWSCVTEAMHDVWLLGRDSLSQWPELRYVSESVRQAWFALSDQEAKPERFAANRSLVEARRKLIKALHDAGAGLLLGSDTPVRAMIAGFAVHRELQALVAAGLTPYQALEVGTRNAAVYFGILDSTGTVAVGKRADLILLSRNPLEDIRQTRQIAGVMLGGHWLSRSELDARLAPLEGKVAGMP